MSETTSKSRSAEADRANEPHSFEPYPNHYARWCQICGRSEDAYQHASAEERAAFDAEQAARQAHLDGARARIARHRAEIEERDYIIHELSSPGFILEQLMVGWGATGFRYSRGGRTVEVQVSVT